jgi:integrase
MGRNRRDPLILRAVECKVSESFLTFEGRRRMTGCRPLSEAEVRLVSQSFGGRYTPRDRALFILGVKSGFRIAELLSIRVGDVWQHARVVDHLTVRRAAMKQPREGRTVPLHPDAQAALATWLLTLRQRPGWTAQTFVCRSRKGMNQAISPVQAWRILREACDTNALTGTLDTHCMRKTFAHKVYQHLGYDLVRTKRALGHQQIRTTERYLSFAQADIDAAILVG